MPKKTNLIFLTRGKVAFVDQEDFKRVNQYNWYYNTNGYAYRRIYLGGGRKNEKAKHLSMHRFVLGEDSSIALDIDHINGNRLDNRRMNLRFASRSQNNANMKLRKDNSSGHKGVYWQSRINKYQVTMRINGKTSHLGYYEHFEVACNVYEDKARQLYGEFVRIV